MTCRYIKCSQEPTNVPCPEPRESNPGSRGLLEKLIVVRLEKKFLAFYEIRRFVTVFTKARHYSLFWALVHTFLSFTSKFI
jgi:hypothetical protein